MRTARWRAPRAAAPAAAPPAPRWLLARAAAACKCMAAAVATSLLSALILGGWQPMPPRAGDSSTSTPAGVELKRWAVLLAYNWIGFSQGMVWVTFSASAPEARVLYGEESMSRATINLLLNWGPITYLVGIWPVMALLSRGGSCVHDCMLLAGWLTAAGSVLRCWPTIHTLLLRASVPQPQPYSTLWLHVGQILNGFSGPAVGASCSAVAACWFAPHERTLATSVAYGVCALGPAVGFVAANWVRDVAGLQWLLCAEAAWSVVGALLWSVLPALPARPPSASSAGRRVDEACHSPTPTGSQHLWVVVQECRRASHNRSFVWLTLAGGVSFGVFQCWAASLPNAMPICAPAAELQREIAPPPSGCMTQTLVQELGTSANFGIWLGTLLVGPLAERHFRRRFGRLLLWLFGAQILLFGILTLSLPMAGGYPPLWSAPSNFRLLCLVGAASVCLGATSPLIIELGAEITFPASGARRC